MKFYFFERLLSLIACLGFSLLVCMPAFSQEKTSINFRDADINSLIESVAEITGKSFIVDPRVRGTVTIIAPEAINSNMLYQAFLSALQVQGFQAVEDGAVIRIVPFNQAFGLSGDGNNELETRLIKVEHVEAASLVPVIKPLLSSSARLQAFSQSNYLVVTDIKSNIEKLIELVKEMDDSSRNMIEVINLSYISPGEAVHIVGQLQGVQEQGLSIVEDSLNNRVIISGSNTARETFKDMLQLLDVPTSRKGGVEVVFLNYARALSLKPIIEGMLQSDMFMLVAGEGDEEASYKVEVDESNNALVVAASSGVIREIKKIVSQLDRLKPQVLIEAVIAELSEDQAKRLSAQLLYSDQDSGAYLTKFDSLLTTLIGVGAGVSSPSDLAVLDQVRGGVAAGGSFEADTGVGFGVLIQALKTDASTRVLSTPSIMTLDNEEASLSIGAEVPFITGSYTTGSDSANNPFQTISREEVGVKLKVLPQISASNTIRLSIEQESSKLIGNGSQLGTADVVTSKSTITTNVLVNDGEMLIIGGLIGDQLDDAVAKIPLLGSLPMIGTFFRSSSKNSEQNVLMMFIRPSIIRDADMAREVSEQKFDYLVNHELGGDVENESSLSSKLQSFMEEE